MTVVERATPVISSVQISDSGSSRRIIKGLLECERPSVYRNREERSGSSAAAAEQGVHAVPGSPWRT
jgi:hypothetical protein